MNAKCSVCWEEIYPGVPCFLFPPFQWCLCTELTLGMVKWEISEVSQDLQEIPDDCSHYPLGTIDEFINLKSNKSQCTKKLNTKVL